MSQLLANTLSYGRQIGLACAVTLVALDTIIVLACLLTWQHVQEVVCWQCICNGCLMTVDDVLTDDVCLCVLVVHSLDVTSLIEPDDVDLHHKAETSVTKVCSLCSSTTVMWSYVVEYFVCCGPLMPAYPLVKKCIALVK